MPSLRETQLELFNLTEENEKLKKTIEELKETNAYFSKNIKKLQEQLQSKDVKIAVLGHELEKSRKINFNY